MDKEAVMRVAEIAADGLFQIAMRAHFDGVARHETVIAMHEFWKELQDSGVLHPQFLEQVFNEANVLCAKRISDMAMRAAPGNETRH